MRECNGESIKGKCRKRIIKGVCLKETVVDRKKGERNRKKIYLWRGRDNKGYNDCETLRERKELRTAWQKDKKCVWLCAWVLCVCVCVCVCVLPVHSVSVCVFDEGSTIPVVLLQDNVCQASSIWHVFDVEIQGAKAQPASVQSPAGHIYHCACAYMCIWLYVRESERGKGRKSNTESHKPQQGPIVTTASMLFFNYPYMREAAVVALAFPELKALWVESILYINSANKQNNNYSCKQRWGDQAVKKPYRYNDPRPFC